MTDTAPSTADTYAGGRTMCDADSHVMETRDWLVDFADPDIRDRIRPMSLGFDEAQVARYLDEACARPTDEVSVARRESALLTSKGWEAMGSFDPAERSRALDLLGFEAQLVFSTFSGTQFAGDDLELLYGGTRAHNRAMAAFCADDQRLLAVGYVPWGPPELVVTEATAALDDGCAAILLNSAPPRDRSPFHPDHDPLWALLQGRDVPFLLHVGGGGTTVRKPYWNTGRPRPTDMFGGGESIRSKDYVTLHQPPEAFLSMMVLDGVLERFADLRGGCIEQGATWVPGMLDRLDDAQRMFAKTEPTVAELPMSASEYVHRQLWFTPFPGEPVGDLIAGTGDDLYMFSSDYPHPEGGRDPIGAFDATMGGLDVDAEARFYAGNFRDLMGRSS